MNTKGNDKYSKGRRGEYHVLKKFKERGYVGTRSAGSHTPADLYVARDGKVMLVQVKRGLPKPGRRADYLVPEDVRMLTAWANHFKAAPMLAYQDASARWHLKNISTGVIYINMEMI